MTAQTFNQALEAEVAKRIRASINGEKDTMGSGNLPDHAAYKYHAGVIQGYEQALVIIAEALKDIQRS